MNPAPLRKRKDTTPLEGPGENVRTEIVPPVQARQGVTLGRMRYVLAISLALVIVAFAIIYFLYF